MPYLIDANNLAGKMGILKEKDFDRRLVQVLCGYLTIKNRKMILVFDGIGSMKNLPGDRRLEIIYAGDYSYGSADEKILDMIRFGQIDQSHIIITDDLGIIQELERIMINKGDYKVIRSSDFAKEIARTLNKDLSEEEDNKEELGPREVKEINEELLELWK
jgi:hypothetical protein